MTTARNASPSHIATPVRYHVPGVISHVHRAVLHELPLLAQPGAARTVLTELNTQAAIYGVHLHAVVIRKYCYDLLLSHASAARTADFLCLANRLISSKLRPKEWKCTFWNGDRPGIDLVTDDPESCGDKLLELLGDADQQLLSGLLAGLAAGSDRVEAAAEQGPVVLAQVAVGWKPAPSRARKLMSRFVQRLRAGLDRLFEARNSHKTHQAQQVPGSMDETPADPPRRRRPRFHGLLPKLRSSLVAAWEVFQHRYHTAATSLKAQTTLALDLGFPKHCLGTPIPTPD